MLLRALVFPLVLGFTLLSSSLSTHASDFETISPAEAGFEPDLADRIDASFEQGELETLHAVVVLRHGKLVFERYYPGRDETWGYPLGVVSFDPDTLHDVRSISKSVTSLLYGIALNDGLVPPLDAAIVDSFPEIADLPDDPRRQDVTIKHVLTMTPGFEWNEDIPYTNPANSEMAMERAHNRFKYILSRPVVTVPGKEWNYSGGTTAILGHLIEKGSGDGLLKFARARLFEPLGIEASDWTRGFNARAAAASGLRLTPRGLARIGQLVLDDGKANGKQVVPADWLTASFQRHADTGDGYFYGYQWWLGDVPTTGRPWIAGIGNGGQRLIIVPEEGLVIVITAGSYNSPNAGILARKIVREFIDPAMTPLE